MYPQKNRGTAEDLRKYGHCYLCETWLIEKSSESNIDFPGFVIGRKDRVQQRGGGIIFIVRRNIAFVEIKDLQYPTLCVNYVELKLLITKRT